MAERTQVFALACATESDGGKDNLPTVLMEAMAASLPCVSTRLAGVPEMVIEGVTGLLSDEGHPTILAAHLHTLLNDKAMCDQMGKAGLEHALAHFSREVTGQHLLACFNELSGWWRSIRCRQLRRRPAKAHGKGFDLARFMAGR